jgi:hypothetical protein
MFVVDESVKRLAATRDQVVTLVEALNQPVVAVPGRSAQNAKAFIVGLRHGDGSYGLYIWLWLTRTREVVVYVNDPHPVPIDAWRDAELDARQFCESMGFMTEPVAFRNLGPALQDELLASLPPFQDPARLTAGPQPEPDRFVDSAAPADAPATSLAPAELERVARLLASF